MKDVDSARNCEERGIVSPCSSLVVGSAKTPNRCEQCHRLKLLNAALVDVKDELEHSLKDAEEKVVDLEDMLCLVEAEGGGVVNRLEYEKTQILKNLEVANKRMRLQVREQRAGQLETFVGILCFMLVVS